MDLKQVTDTILESFRGVMSQDFEVTCQLTDTVSEIKLRSKEGGKQFHLLVLESLPDKSGGES